MFVDMGNGGCVGVSIKNDAYQLCKVARSSDSSDRIKTIISNINRSSENRRIAGNDRSSFGLLARHYHIQVLGYLVVNRDKHQLELDYPPLKGSPGLNDDERRFLAGIQHQFGSLNQACLATLPNGFPGGLVSVDPYARFRYVIPNDVDAIRLFSQNDVRSMAQSFSTHPGFGIALDAANQMTDRLTDDEILRSVNLLGQGLLERGPSSSPENLTRLALTASSESNKRLIVRFISSLLCIRESLGILNELVYQALFFEQLPVATSENIIDWGAMTSHVCGQGLVILCQPDEGHGIGAGLMDRRLVLVRDSVDEIPFDLGRVESFNYQASNELGDVIEIQLREIDENLNPFGGLLRFI